MSREAIENETIEDVAAVGETLAGEHADDNLTGHSYDGIQEYDNPLPGWWKFLFLGVDYICAAVLFLFPCRGRKSLHLWTV